jgi:hypothetical protein
LGDLCVDGGTILKLISELWCNFKSLVCDALSCVESKEYGYLLKCSYYKSMSDFGIHQYFNDAADDNGNGNA